MNELCDQLKILFDEEFGLTDLANNDLIFSENLLDSMDVLRLILSLQDKYSITIPALDLTIEMLDSINLIADYVSGRISSS